MNWRRAYAAFQISFTVCLASVFGAGCYTVVVVGICRRVIKIADSVSVFAIGLPFFVVLTLLFIRFLPRHLGKAGMLSDDPAKFGPWFR